MRNIIKGIYAITDEKLISISSFENTTKEVIEAGISAIQYRSKSLPYKTQLYQCRHLREICTSFGVLFIVNDNIELAITTNADGIHLGKDDDDIQTARKSLGKNKIIGVSCYNSLERALLAEKNGADYIAFGRFFPSKTKPNAPQADIKTLIKASKSISIPIVAIGGIDISNGKNLIDNGASSLAVINSIFDSDSPKESTEKLCSLF